MAFNRSGSGSGGAHGRTLKRESVKHANERDSAQYAGRTLKRESVKHANERDSAQYAAALREINERLKRQRAECAQELAQIVERETRAIEAEKLAIDAARRDERKAQERRAAAAERLKVAREVRAAKAAQKARICKAEAAALKETQELDRENVRRHRSNLRMERPPTYRRRGAGERVRSSEERDAVTREIEVVHPNLLPLWLSVRESFHLSEKQRAAGRLTLAEAFVHWAHDDPEAVAAARPDTDDAALAREQAEHEATRPRARKRGAASKRRSARPATKRGRAAVRAKAPRLAKVGRKRAKTKALDVACPECASLAAQPCVDWRGRKCKPHRPRGHLAREHTEGVRTHEPVQAPHATKLLRGHVLGKDGRSYPQHLTWYASAEHDGRWVSEEAPGVAFTEKREVLRWLDQWIPGADATFAKGPRTRAKAPDRDAQPRAPRTRKAACAPERDAPTKAAPSLAARVGTVLAAPVTAALALVGAKKRAAPKPSAEARTAPMFAHEPAARPPSFEAPRREAVGGYAPSPPGQTGMFGPQQVEFGDAERRARSTVQRTTGGRLRPPAGLGRSSSEDPPF